MSRSLVAIKRARKAKLAEEQEEQEDQGPEHGDSLVNAFRTGLSFASPAVFSPFCAAHGHISNIALHDSCFLAMTANNKDDKSGRATDKAHENQLRPVC